MTDEITALSGAEKCQAPRLITPLPVGVKLSKGNGEEIGVSRVVNISCSGISLIVSRHLNIESELSIKIKLPSSSTGSIKGVAKVRRCDDLGIQVDREKQYLCGLSLGLETESKQQLEKFISDVITEGNGVVDRRGSGRRNNGMELFNPAKYSSYRLGQENHQVQIQELRLRDLDELERVEIAAWGKDMCATRAMLQSRLEIYPEGMIGARQGNDLLGYVCVMKVDSEMCDKDFTWMGLTDGGYIRATHDPNGNCLYGVSLSVIPSAPKDIAVKLLKNAEKLAVRRSLKGVLLGCRVPNYHKHAKRMSIEQYISATSKTGRMLDPELSLYRQVNGIPVRPIPNYFEDPESLNYGVLIFWENPLYALQKREFPFFFKSVSVDFT